MRAYDACLPGNDHAMFPLLWRLSNYCSLIGRIGEHRRDIDHQHASTDTEPLESIVSQTERCGRKMSHSMVTLCKRLLNLPSKRLSANLVM